MMTSPQNPKKITIVAHALTAGGGISVGRNLIRSLQQELPHALFQVFIPADLDYESCVVLPEQTEVHTCHKQKNVLQRLAYDFFYLEGKIKKFQPDLVLCLGNRGVKYSECIQLLLCHDPHLFYPTRFYATEIVKKKMLKWLQRRRLASDLCKTDILLLQTEVAADRIREMYGYRGEVVLLPNAVSIDVIDSAQPRAIPERVRAESSAFKIFYLTRYYPHKNIELLIQLFNRYRKELADCRLFITVEASQHPLAKRLLMEIEQLGLEQQVINLGPLSQNELPAYYRNMDVLAMPTTLESFSGTYLEAMQFGCPILTSDLDFARAICGEAAFYFDPWSVDSLFQSVQSLRQNPALIAQLKLKGEDRLKHFTVTWEQNGKRLAAAIHNILELK